MDDLYGKYSGFLFYPLMRSDFWASVNNSPACSSVKELTTGWFSFIVSPSTAWEYLDDFDELFNREELERKEYSFLIRHGGQGRFILLSTRTVWVKRLLRDLGMINLLNNTPTVAISDLMHDLRKTPRISSYALGAVYAKIQGYGQALRTIILYGDDIASAGLFNDHIVDRADPYRLTLRKTRWHEVLSIGDKADVSFDFNGIGSLIEVDSAIRTIGRKMGHLDWG